MTGAAIPASEAPAEAVEQPPKRRGSWLSLIAKTALSLVVALMLLVGALAVLLDTDLGHRLILDRIAAMAPDSGLRIRIGRLEGSIWGRTELKDVRLYDPEGLFAEAPSVELEWQPLAWLTSRLVVRDVHSELVIVHRLPRLDTDEDSAILPDYDVHVGRLEIEQLRVGEEVAGARRTARITGEADFRSGRALLDLDAAMRGGGDRLALLVDAAPDRDQFDLDVRLEAPANGVVGELLGTAEPVRLEVSGDGSWREWNGLARLQISGRPAGDLRLVAQSGRYAAGGWLAPAPLLTDRLAALSGPRLLVGARGTIDDGVVDGTLSARSAALRLLASGTVDLRRNLYRDLRVAAELPRPMPLLGRIEGSGVTVTALLDGPFAGASVAYRFAAATLRAGSTAFEDVRATGSGRLTRRGLAVPVAGSVGRVTGVGADAILSDLRIGGAIFASGDIVQGRNLTVSSERLRGRLAFDADLATGRYALTGSATAPGYRLEGIGLADLRSDFRASATAAGSAMILSGTAEANVRRLDSPVLRWAVGGAPRIGAGLANGPDGSLRLPNLSFSSPALQLSGSGAWRPDGTLMLEASGRHSRFGPLSLRAEGAPARPRFALRLARPSPLLSNIALEVEPAADGFGYRGRGGSPLGPFSARGSVAIVRGRPATVRVSALAISGATGSGLLRPANGGMQGQIGLRGALAGPLVFTTPGGAQRIEAHLVASDARLGDVPIGSGRLDGEAEIGGEGALRGNVRFAGDAARLWRLAGVERMSLSGPLAVTAELGGTVARPEIRGSARLSRGRLAGAASGTVVEQLESTGSFDRTRLVLRSFEGRTRGGGSIEGSGTIGLDSSSDRAVDLRIEARQARLVSLPGFAATVSGPIRLQSAGAGGTISGNLRVHDSELRFGGSSAGRGGGESASPWRLALRIAAERIAVKGSGLDSEWRAEIRVGGTLSSPVVLGEASLVSGRYLLLGRRFELSRGTMRFEGESPPDPRLDILARAPDGGLLGALRITGRASRPEIGIVNPLAPSPEEPPRQPAAGLAPPEAARQAGRRG